MMSSETTTAMASARLDADSDQPLGGTRFDWVMTLFTGWLMAGLFFDGWAHQHEQVDTFFAPWHGVLFSAPLAVFIFAVPW